MISWLLRGDVQLFIIDVDGDFMGFKAMFD